VRLRVTGVSSRGAAFRALEHVGESHRNLLSRQAHRKNSLLRLAPASKG
jgi:hypothetical protein